MLIMGVFSFNGPSNGVPFSLIGSRSFLSLECFLSETDTVDRLHY